ncbi:MAG: leucyl aminopeptidase, partial [Planctomycetes bacterium]|nr:leucyl aminopeptidase [Planctomycetota bacterium]
MQFHYASDAGKVAADLLVLPVFESDNPLKPYAFADQLGAVKGDIKGKSGEITILPSRGAVAAARVCVLGLGKQDKVQEREFGEALAGVFRHGSIHSLKLRHVAVDLGAVVKLKGIKTETLGRWAAEAAILASYQFDVLITKADKKKETAKEVTLVGGNKDKLQRGVAYGEVTAVYTAHCRDLVNEPSNRINPATLAKFAQDMAKAVPGLKCKVLHKPEIEKLKMGAFLGVNAGSDIPAHLIILEWHGGKKDAAPIAYVGKGLCFDSGGYDIKPAAGMLGMKMDMAGGAATICTLGAIGKLKLKINAVGVVPATENLINGSAYHPGCVLTSMSGQTIEIGNTDAEGRLILCDALTYTQREYKPK